MPCNPESKTFLLSFIDDTALGTLLRSLEANIAFLQKQYPIWKRTFALLCLELEDDKTELFHVWAYQPHVRGKPLFRGSLPNLEIRSDAGETCLIKPQTAWHYLGFIFDPELSFKAHVDRWAIKGSTTLRAYHMLGNSQRGLTLKDKQLIYITTALPILIYGFQLWYRSKGKGVKHLVKRLHQVHTAAVWWITGGFPDSHSGALIHLASLLPMQLQLDKQLYGAGL